MTLPAWLVEVVTFAHPGWLVLLAASAAAVAAAPRPAGCAAGGVVADVVRRRADDLARPPALAARRVPDHRVRAHRVALAGPERITPAREGVRPGLDVLLLIDVSQSMRARDGTPDRLGSAIALSQAVVKARPRDRIGVLLFAGDHAIACPLTVDHASVDRSPAGDHGVRER